MTDHSDIPYIPDTPGIHEQYSVVWTDGNGEHRVVMPNNTVQCRRAHLDYLATERGITARVERRSIECQPWEAL